MIENTEKLQGNRSWLVPAYDVSKEEDAIVLKIEMPGVDRDNLDITVENSRLYVSGHRGDDGHHEGRWLLRERRHGDYRRVFTLDETADPDSISAEIVNGVLTMRIGFKAAARPRKIEVKSN